MFEGTFKYFFAIFIIYLVSILWKKVEMSKIFKKANVKPSTAFIPFMCTKKLIEISHADKKLFSKTLIPFVSIAAYIAIYKELIKTFGADEKEALLYYLMPMVYFTKLGSGNYRLEIHDYDLKNEYLEAQNMLYAPVTGEEEKPIYDMTDSGYYMPMENKEPIVYKINKNNNLAQENIPEMNVKKEKNILDIPPKMEEKNVFTDNSLEPDLRQEKIVVATKEEERKKPLVEDALGRPKMCPNCGAKLASTAKSCFLCGTRL